MRFCSFRPAAGASPGKIDAECFVNWKKLRKIPVSGGYFRVASPSGENQDYFRSADRKKYYQTGLQQNRNNPLF
jgi:hypothetical protein